jgi:hypothetical protein
MNKPLKTVPLKAMIDKHIGKLGTERREAFESKLKIELLDHTAKQARQEQQTKKINEKQ